MRAINDRDEPRNEREAADELAYGDMQRQHERAAWHGAMSLRGGNLYKLSPSGLDQQGRYKTRCDGGPCAGNTKLCPTPAACVLDDDSFESADSEVLLMLAAVAVAIIVGLADFVIVIK